VLLQIGFVGLVEEEWLDTLTTVDKSNLNYTDYVERGRQIASELRVRILRVFAYFWV